MPMLLVSFVLIVAVVVRPSQPAKVLGFSDILPKEFSLWTPLDWQRGDPTIIKDKLIELGAYVRNGKIFDRGGKQIVFAQIVRGMAFSLLTWESGNKPPEYHPGTTEEKRQIIEKLQKKYTLIIVSLTLK
jgi:hypothetical protein